MLKQDFNGFKEFKEKLMNASEQVSLEVCMERVEMWTNKILDVINPLPGGGCSIRDRSFRNNIESNPRRQQRRRIDC